MKKFKKFILPSILLVVGFVFICVGLYLQHEVYLLEFNKQIEVVGFYTEDIHYLDLYDRYKASSIWLFSGAFTMLGNIIHIVLLSLENYFENKKNNV